MKTTSLRLASPELDAFVAEGRSLMEQHFPGQDFESAVWSARERRVSAHSKTNANIYFTRHGSTAEPLPRSFAAVLKADLLVHPKSTTNMNFRLSGARLLWEAVLERRGGDAATFTWAGLTKDDCLAAEQKMLAVWGELSTYRTCTVLAGVMARLARRGITTLHKIPFVTPRPAGGHAGGLQLDDVATIEQTVLSDRAIAAIGLLYRELREERERVLINIVTLLFVGGFRLGEVLTLPADCKVVDRGLGGGERRGIRFQKEKGKNRGRVTEIRWLTPVAAELAFACVDEVLALTERFRRQAAVLEWSPDETRLAVAGIQAGRWCIEEHGTADGYVSLSLITDLLGVEPSGVAGAGWRQGAIRRAEGEVYVRSAVATWLHQERRRRCPESIRGVVKRADGTWQRLSESLFVVPLNFFSRQKANHRLLVCLVNEQNVSDWLDGRWENCEPTAANAVQREGAFMRRVATPVWEDAEICSRLGDRLKEADSSPIQMNSHDLRKWLTTKAALSGIEDAVIMRWQNREHAGDLSAYKLLTTEERLRMLRAALQSGKLQGEVAQQYFSIIDPVEREAWLSTRAMAVHVSPFGLCVHDFAVTPCKYALNCLRGCSDYLRDTSCEAQTTNLVQLRRRSVMALSMAETRAAEGRDDLAEAWVEDARETVRGIDLVLEAQPAEGESLIRPFSGNPSRFVPMEGRSVE